MHKLDHKKAVQFKNDNTNTIPLILAIPFIIILIWLLIFNTNVEATSAEIDKFSIVEWSNGDITYNIGVISYPRFFNDRVPIEINHYNTWRGKGVFIPDSPPGYPIDGFESEDGTPFMGYLGIRSSEITPDQMLQLYTTFGKNWPAELFKRTPYYTQLQQYTREHSNYYLTYDVWSIGNCNVNTEYSVNLYSLDPKISNRIRDARANSMTPGYIADDNGDSYSNNLDSTDVMTKTSSQYIKDVIVQSHVKGTKFTT